MSDQQNDSRVEAKQSFFAKQRLLDKAKLAFQQLSGLLKNVTIYPESHPFLLALVEKLMGTIEELIADRKEAAFYFVTGELFFETYSMPVDQSIVALVDQFTMRDVGGLVFKPGVQAEEFIRLAVLMNKETSVLAQEGGILSIVTREAIPHISLHSVLLVNKKKKDAAKEDRKKATGLYMKAIVSLKEIVRNVQISHSVNMRRMNSIIQNMVDSILEDSESFIGLTNIKVHDEYTYAHCVNTSILAIALGASLDLDKPQIAMLGMSAIMHDIGKMLIPPEIINKTDNYSEEEYEIIKRHPIDGALILSDIQGITKMAMITAYEHHQHGADGYPQTEKRNRQHPFSQIMSIVDAYDVLNAGRVYYNLPGSPDQVIAALTDRRGSSFSEILLKAFINMIGVFPIGTLLKLSGGEVGLVVKQSSDLMRPHVLLLTKFDGSEKDSGEEISLLEMVDGKYKHDVAGIINPHTAHINVKKYLE